MRIVIPGGSGQLGRVLVRWLEAEGHDIQVIGRSVSDPALRWDGVHDGPWMDAIDGADAVINLAGRTVNCRYHWDNLEEMMRSRVDSALAVGRAIAAANDPPAVWLQASTASIYPDSDGPVFDEDCPVGPRSTGRAPAYWSYSVSIARAWELAQQASITPHTRKVALRTGFTMSPDRGGVFDVLLWLVRCGLGGRYRSGRQFVSWIGDRDLGRALTFLLDSDLQGPVNLVAPEPIPNARFMAELRAAAGQPVGLPILPGMDTVGAWLLSTDGELMHKSRRVVPKRLLDAGFTFAAPVWADAAVDLHARWRSGRLDAHPGRRGGASRQAH
jgi:hypothetical protein